MKKEIKDAYRFFFTGYNCIIPVKKEVVSSDTHTFKVVYEREFQFSRFKGNNRHYRCVYLNNKVDCNNE